MKVFSHENVFCVADSKFAGLNFYWVLFIIFIAVVIKFGAGETMVALGLIVVLIVSGIYIVKFQKEFSQNLEAWKKYGEKGMYFDIDYNSSKIYTDNGEIPLYDIKEVKFVALGNPPMIGYSKKLFEKFFVNACIEINTGAKISKVPVHSKATIKKLEKLFTNLSMNTTVDVKLHHI